MLKSFFTAIILIVGAGFVGYWGLYKAEKKDARSSNAASLFYRQQINDRLTYIYNGSAYMDELGLENSNNTFIVHLDAEANAPLFRKKAEIGDSVIKAAYSDSLVLVTMRGERYLYRLE